ncbi:hypothetical protein FACS1894166_07490 [Bacilli bacterium]|nr:hypothetical protein FACS1894166_07490 [Bacilli bacterium]
MKSNEMLKEIQQAIGISVNKMYPIFGVNRASFYRYINGQNEMGFDLASNVLNKVKIRYENNQLVAIHPELIRLVNAMNNKDKKAVMLFFRDVLEFVDRKKLSSENIPDAEIIIDRNYRIFYQVLINYLLNKPIDKNLVLNEKWSPLAKIYPSQRERLDSFFLSHNIILPSGELK